MGIRARTRGGRRGYSDCRKVLSTLAAYLEQLQQGFADVLRVLRRQVAENAHDRCHLGDLLVRRHQTLGLAVAEVFQAAGQDAGYDGVWEAGPTQGNTQIAARSM